MARIVFSGMMVNDPYQGGATWAVLQYVLGLKQLGHEVLFIEPISEHSFAASADFAESDQWKYFRHITERFDLTDSAALLLPTREPKSLGIPFEKLREFCSVADALFNVAGMLTNVEAVEQIPCRIYLDLDPAFVQLWATDGIDMRLEGHTHFVTVGLAIGSDRCDIPTCGRRWIATLQPICLDHWPVTTTAPVEGVTTIANWRGYGSVNHNGQFLGQKAHSLREFVDLPRHTDEVLRLALSIHPDEVDDIAALTEGGWKLLDPGKVACTPDEYQHFISRSKAEFGIAKSGYVKSRCGWFSDRSVCYLASGRPVIAQDTGFSHWLPTGAGLFAFTTTEDFLVYLEAIRSDYSAHCQAAREVAEQYFDSRKVLPHLLRETGLAA